MRVGQRREATFRGRRYFVSPFLHASRRHVTPIYSVTARAHMKTGTFPATIGARLASTAMTYFIFDGGRTRGIAGPIYCRPGGFTKDELIDSND